MEKHPERQYVIREGKLDGLYAVMTVNYALKDYTYKFEYPWCLEIVVEIREQNFDLLPTNDEAKILYTFEDNIEILLSRSGDFHFIGRMSWNGERTLLYYLKEPKQAHQALQDLIEKTEGIKRQNPEAIREFEYDLREDELWEAAQEYFE